MTAQPATTPPNTTLDAEATGIVADLLEEHGSGAAALRALAHDFVVLLADADRSVSRGYLLGVFLQGPRPAVEKDNGN